MTSGHHGLSQSVMTRLVMSARKARLEPNVVLARFAIERLLYRLSVSPYATRFVLKGATLLSVWLGETARPTRDADLAGFGDLSDESLRAIFQDLCAIEVTPDGMTFDPATIRIAGIREEDEYGGRRIRLVGNSVVALTYTGNPSMMLKSRNGPRPSGIWAKSDSWTHPP
jgi:hypothetical protein